MEGRNIEVAGKKKARPLGRAGLGAGVWNAPLGGHPYTCNLAAARGAVVVMHVVMNALAHADKLAGRVALVKFPAEFEGFAAQRSRAKDCISGRL